MPEAADVTALLTAWKSGDEAALDRLIPLVYAELRRIARRYLAHERPDHTLQPTALVHEAFLRLTDQRKASWRNRAQFFGIAAQVMRRILVDHARRAHALKRGGGMPALPLEQAPGTTASQIPVLALDAALARLAAMDPRQARIVELRFFTGLTFEEAAHVLGSSATTVRREWASAKAWLYRELEAEISQ